MAMIIRGILIICGIGAILLGVSMFRFISMAAIAVWLLVSRVWLMLSFRLVVLLGR